MQAFAHCPASTLSGIRYLLTDIDDTLTHEGRLAASTLAALERLDAAGIKVIPVTGGCAGWCDHIARAWPVASVIGENGAFAFRRQGQRILTTWWEDEQRLRARQRHVMTVARQLLLNHPRAALAQDQPFRFADVAVDHCQAVGPLAQSEIRAIIAGFTAAGIQARASSIHINAWQGEFDKARMAVRVLTETFGLDRMQLEQEVMYVGDAPNDAPMFATFRHTVGVANIIQHRAALGWEPCWVTRHSHGTGVEEIAEALLTARKGVENVKTDA
ncbi:HAD-IIB family hydrolase [Cobetia sp. MB87]|uniref:HAD-IIB family hydrolase n=1 Tax=Cobetia sp. MB87 TaxID=2588451 RepID=UPI00140803FA|nr:HAD-IIB family hydrolase [Cobetia sp. MB87]NHH86123.1 Mannosyl-3-phosphoglycerate phosphatase [Cobetia sp. MB87]